MAELPPPSKAVSQNRSFSHHGEGLFLTLSLFALEVVILEKRIQSSHFVLNSRFL
jgi:hypothetical protein